MWKTRLKQPWHNDFPCATAVSAVLPGQPLRADAGTMPPTRHRAMPLPAARNRAGISVSNASPWLIAIKLGR